MTIALAIIGIYMAISGAVATWMFTKSIPGRHRRNSNKWESILAFILLFALWPFLSVLLWSGIIAFPKEGE